MATNNDSEAVKTESSESENADGTHSETEVEKRIPCEISRLEIICLILVLLIASALRFYHLGSQGIRTSDGGLYAWQAWKVLQGGTDAIEDKPGHTLLVVVSYYLLGLEMKSPLYMSSLLGVGMVVMVWLTVRQWYGRHAGMLAALFTACMPYLLLYHRSANSDGNLVSSLAAAMFLYSRALLKMENAELHWTESLLHFGLAGLMFGLSLSINYSMATTFVPLCISLCLLMVLKRRQRWQFASGLGGMALGTAIGFGAVIIVMWPYIAHKELWRQILYHKSGFLKSNFSVRPFSMLAAYAGIPAILLGAAGVYHMCRRKRSFDLAILILCGFMAISYFRTLLTYPRIFICLCLPLVITCGAGIDFIRATLTEKRKRPAPAIALAAAVVLVFQSSELKGAVELKSGYQEVCSFLKEDGLELGLSTHSWWTFEAFTGKRFGYCSDALAQIMDSPRWESKLPRYLNNRKRQGFTHLVLDYYLWNCLRLEHNSRFESSLMKYPIAFMAPNPAANHKQTIDEDGNLPPPGANPLAQHIYVIRLSDIPDIER